MFRKWILLLAALPLSAQTQSVDTFFKDTFGTMLRNDPDFATGIGHHEFDDRWTDYSKAARDHRREFFEQSLTTLDKYPTSGMSRENQLTTHIVQYDFHSLLDAWDLSTYLLRVGQLFGFHNRVYLVVDRMPGRTLKDYQNILARLNGIPALVDQNIAILDEAIAKKLTQPKVVTDLVIQQLTAQMNQDAQHTALLEAFRKFPPNIPASQQKQLLTEATDAYNNKFLPSWRKLRGYMTNTYAAHVRPEVSISSLPNGRADYAILVRALTTTNMSAEEIHSLGEKEVARIEGEMKAAAAQTGFTGSLQEFQEKLKTSPDQHFETKEDMLIYCRNIAKIIEPQLPNQFHNIPKLLYGVRPIPADREAATATNAQAPSPDFTAPGWFNLNTYEPEKQVKYDKQSLVLHEAVPGHIFQITLAEALPDLPEIRKFYHNSAYIEGWALYAESLGSQLGLYQDPYHQFGQLASERFRAVRLVVDTGIHELGWTREQALEYFHQHAPEESVAEIDRYISWPAQALSYKMGQLRIMQLREEAQQKLGPKFDIREFNDAVLREGTLPLEVLTEQMDQFIAAAAR
jgi:uncharacterized protein (DUF885 family)